MHMTPWIRVGDASSMLTLRQSLDVNKRSHLDTIWMHVLRINLAQLWPGLDLPDGLIFQRHSYLLSQSNNFAKNTRFERRNFEFI
jgi:hypothetical protein